jgi:sugar lactone lactonase YvrE
MRMRSKRASMASAMAMAIMVAIVPAARATGHVETIVAFDPEQGQLPEGVAVDADGNVFASLTTLGQLVKIPAGASEAEAFGSVEGLAEGEFGPVGLAIDAEGNVYSGVSSQNPEANGVWRFDAATGAGERIAGSESILFANDVAFGADGTLYITDTIAGSVWRAPEGGAAELWIEDPLLAGTGEAGFGFPVGANGIAVGDDVVYVGVTETALMVAVPIAEDGTAGEASLFFQMPEAVDGIALDAAGNLISTHPLANQITKLSPDGELEVIAEVEDGLDRPSTVALVTGADGSTTLYIANFSIAMGTELGAGPSILALDLGGRG